MEARTLAILIFSATVVGALGYGLRRAARSRRRSAAGQCVRCGVDAQAPIDRITLGLLLGLATLPAAVHAQAPAEQIAAAVTALPPDLRDGAAVLGYAADGKLVQLREGKNDMICLASDPKLKSFHVACYHRSMEPFMARGRELRAQGVTGDRVDTVRFAEVKSGKLKMPSQPAVLYQIFGGTFDPASGKASGGRLLYVVYIPFATAASTGLSAVPSEKAPWIMFPGTPKAHIMFTAGM